MDTKKWSWQDQRDSEETAYDVDSCDRVIWSVTSMPAIDAEVSVASTPENKAESATRDTSPARDGAI